MNTYVFNTPDGLIKIPGVNRIMAYELFEDLYPELVKDSDIVEVVAV